jgi:predicted TIM-barrel fold metal-dependent hydrolase
MTDGVGSDDFVYMRGRKLDFPVFDADNHMYETQEAMTKFIPKEYVGIIKYVEINGRTKIAIKDHISDYIPNPTFNRVASPGRNADPSLKKAIPSVDAFFDPEPRLMLMKDMGIDKTVLWPTLASVLEERLWDDPKGVQVVVHALNEWMHEHWTFNYADAIYSTPIISLSIMSDAIEELQRVADRGAKAFLIRVAPVPTYDGRKSFALPEFDPFWELAQELDLSVGMHSGDPGYHRYTNEWEGFGDLEFRPFVRPGNPGFSVLASEKSPIVDAMASIIGHGLATRFPKLRFLPTEYGVEWVRPFVTKLRRAAEKNAVFFDENPVDTFNRSVFVHAFQEDDPADLATYVPVDNITFGSDFPHPEGLADPLGWSEKLESFSAEDQAKIMGGNMARAMHVSL